MHGYVMPFYCTLLNWLVDNSSRQIVVKVKMSPYLNSWLSVKNSDGESKKWIQENMMILMGLILQKLSWLNSGKKNPLRKDTLRSKKEKDYLCFENWSYTRNNRHNIMRSFGAVHRVHVTSWNKINSWCNTITMSKLSIN